MVKGNMPLLSLMRLVSPALPVGAYSYSQGFEHAVESGWVTDKAQTVQWISGVMGHSIVHLELPLLRNAYKALINNEYEQLCHWNQQSLAFRESRELRLEDIQMGKALWKLLSDLDIPLPPDIHQPSWVVAYSTAAHYWGVDLESAAYGFVWAWLENQLAAAAKLVPLGQTDVQRATDELLLLIPELIIRGLSLDNEQMGAGMPGLVIGSMQHETQYSRLFRS